MRNVISPIFLVYPLHLNILFQGNETKRWVSCWMHETWYIRSYHVHISYWNKVTFDTEFLEKLLAVLKLESQINCFYYSIQITLFWFISLHSYLTNSSDKPEATANCYFTYCFIWKNFLLVAKPVNILNR